MVVKIGEWRVETLEKAVGLGYKKFYEVFLYPLIESNL
ncbi:hypothetical protein DESC_700194 [Desulfosarcina cetonica]|nr:hypothetical protein DESC_700194 [Desulfosarcina cetonica]